MTLAPGIDVITDHVLTADDISGIAKNLIKDDPLLDISNGLSDKQKARLSRAIFPQNVSYAGNAPFLDRVIDNDKNGLLSVGDRIVVRRFSESGGRNELSARALTQAQLDRYTAGESYILNPEPRKLDLTDKQQAAVGSRFDRIPPPNLSDGITIKYTGVALDSNGDGKLSAGDTVKLRETGGLLGLDRNT